MLFTCIHAQARCGANGSLGSHVCAQPLLLASSSRAHQRLLLPLAAWRGLLLVRTRPGPLLVA